MLCSLKIFNPYIYPQKKKEKKKKYSILIFFFFELYKGIMVPIEVSPY